MKNSLYRKLIPLIAFICFAGIALVLWRNQSNHAQELMLRHTETNAEQVRLRIEGLMNARIASLKLLADRWVERQPPDFSRRRFVGFADILFKHYPGFSGINWVDAEGTIQWVFPEKEGPSAPGENVFEGLGTACRTALSSADQKPRHVMTPCGQLDQGGVGFGILLPLIYEGKVQGYLQGIFEVDRIMSVSLAKDVLEDFKIKILEEDSPVYERMNRKSLNTERDGIRVTRNVQFYEKNWRIELEPTAGVYSFSSAANLLIPGFGIALSAALSLLLYFLLQRMRMYKETRDRALYEVSERKKAESALRENEKKLEALLSELSSKNMELESFVYTVSHDLKTPIVTIEGYIGALREDFGGSLSEIGEKYLNYMSDAARKMEALINDLLNLSRIGRLIERKSEVSFGSIVKDAVETLRPQIDARRIVVDVQDSLPIVLGERKRLAQVMDNLLSNAVKYIGKDNPSPFIKVGFEEFNGERVFFVSDNGIGIEEKYFNKVFQIFERLPGAKAVGKGTGIGLTIVKRIIENHGGRIWLTSSPGKGTTFYFTLKGKGS